MANFQVLSAPRTDPYAYENTKAVMDIINNLGKAEALRRNEIIKKNVLQAIASGAGAEGVSQAAMMSPEYSEGLPGLIQRISSPFARMNQTSTLDDIIAGRAIENAMVNPLDRQQKMADIAYKLSRAENPRLGTLPGWWGVATEEQKQNYLNNIGKPVTVNVGGFSTSEKKTLAGEMDARIKKAKKLRVGANYKDEDLFREWKNFISVNTFENNNQKENAWNAWRLKVESKGGEANWDPTDPKWRQAIGLPAKDQTKTNNTKTLEAETAKKILQEADGNKEKARQIARERGYDF